MKIGILTYHAVCNFGANLQAYCTMRYFQSLGHEAKVINYVAPEYMQQDKVSSEQVSAHWKFSQETLYTTELLNEGGQALYELVKSEGFHLIVVGSDAVWNYANIDEFRVFHADWLWESDLKDTVKVVALSPAFMGQSYSGLPSYEKLRFATSLRNFSFLTTRDSWTRDVINKEVLEENLIDIINPDPAFLLDDICQDEWIIPEYIEKKKYYIMSLSPNFCKVHPELNRTWFKKFKKEINIRGYQLVELPLPEGLSGFDFDYTVPYPIDPLQWFLWLKNAKAFVGLRFHAVVSCISAGTPFYSLDIYGKSSSKVISYLNKVGFHYLDHRFNKSSKIRNILDGSGLERYRINGDAIFMTSPSSLIRRLENYNMDALASYRADRISTFKKNVAKMLDTLV